MNTMLKRNIGAIVVVCVSLFLPYLAMLNPDGVERFKHLVNLEVFYFLPFWLFGISAYLAYKFNLQKVVFYSLYFMSSYFVFQNTGPVTDYFKTPLFQHQIFAVATPLTLILLFLLPMKNFWKWGGIIHVLGAFAPLALFTLASKFLVHDFTLIAKWQVPGFAFTNLPGSCLIFLGFYMAARFFQEDRYMKKFHKYTVFAFLAVLFVLEHGGADKFLMAVAFIGAGNLTLTGVIRIDWEKVYFDELTGIHNRRALNEALAKLDSNYSLAMVDIDFFKKVNDTYGHEEGDRLLRKVAMHLDRETGGAAYRFGGEEFAIIYKGRPFQDVAKEIDQIRKNLAQKPFFIRGPDRPRSISETMARALRKKDRTGGIQVTISVGIAAAEKGLSLEEVFKTADERLYRAKERGRNQVVSTSGQEPPEKSSRSGVIDVPHGEEAS
jgi:GGDEF domain-containing protein